ncbi:MAG: C39 family peptidase [Anaerolineae bacterium]
MPAKRLKVPYHPQLDDGYCLPACAQMVLDYLGIIVEQKHLARILGVRVPLGAPASNVLRLRSETVEVIFAEGAVHDLRNYLALERPLIVFVQAGELPHWRGCVSQHAIVVVGIDEASVDILDPAAGSEVIDVPLGDFLLAWSELSYLYAVITTQGAP